MNPWRYEGTFYAVRNRNDSCRKLYHGSDPPCLDSIQSLDKSEQGYPPLYAHLILCEEKLVKYPVKRVCEGEWSNTHVELHWNRLNWLHHLKSNENANLWGPSHPRGHHGRRRSWLIGCQAHDAPTQSDWLKIWWTLLEAMYTWTFLMSSNSKGLLLTLSLLSLHAFEDCWEKWDQHFLKDIQLTV